MRKLIVGACVAGLFAGTISAADVEETRAWVDTFAVNTANPTLEIRNIWGDVNVAAGEAGEISVSVRERRTAPDQRRFDRSLQFLKLNTEAGENGVSMRVGNRNGDWGWGNRCRGCRAEYSFDVRVPPGTQLDISTVNDGKVEVSGVSGPVSAGNVNGPVTVSGVDNCAMLEAVNGGVTASFSRAPGADCDIETVNGDIVISVPSGSGFNVAMDLFNGRMYSAFPVDPLAIPARVEQSRSDGGFHYRIEQPAGVTIAGGGPTFSVSSINGDVRIQKTQ